MKITHNHFEHYLSANHKNDLHPKLKNVFDKMPDNLESLPNVIIYGPSGVGKYTQTLNLIKKYSPSQLKYDKKISISINKTENFYKISDIHYEVDMSLLGCNAKTNWHELYIQIIDIICSKPSKIGIILCKNFHMIHNDLLDVFYSYMQQNYFLHIDIKFVLISEQISFIPQNIINNSQHIHIPRPSKASYEKITGKKMKIKSLENISNIVDIENNVSNINPHKQICDKIIQYILQKGPHDFSECRELLYELLVYELNISECIWYILRNSINQDSCAIDEADMSEIIDNSYLFFKYYNNNYRPIFHLERFIYFIICKLHKIKLISSYLDVV
jgi:hypothetical protein|tara:strand:+ start:1075 stop:2067 length:993 start_codon:yes stop_codon:yes gene_type:complete